MAYKTFNTNLAVSRFDQAPYECPIASSGIVANYLTGSTLDARTAREKNGGSSSMQWTTFAANCNLRYDTSLSSTYSGRIPKSGESSFSQLKNDLFNFVVKDNVPVVVRVTNPNTNPPDHFVVVKGFYGTLPTSTDINGNEIVNTSSITPSMFKVADPEPDWADNQTLQDVINDKLGGELRALYVYRLK